MANNVILAAQNASVDDINQKVVNLIDILTEKSYTAINSTENCGNQDMEEVSVPEF